MKKLFISFYYLLILPFPSLIVAEENLLIKILPELIQIPSGQFLLDNSNFKKFPKSEKNQNEKIKIGISNFFITKSPILRKQWEEILGDEFFHPWERERKPFCPDCYAEGFTYMEAEKVIQKMNSRFPSKNYRYRLPRESELYYILSSCNKPCGFWKNQSQSLTGEFTIGRNESFFGIQFPEDEDLIYLWTEDFPYNNYLEYYFTNQKDTNTVQDPSPPSSTAFDYGKILVGIPPRSNRNSVYRMGHSKKMLPSNLKIYLYIVKEDLK